MVSNKLHREWEEQALWQLKGKKPVVKYPVAISCMFYMKDNRHRDLDNCLSSVLDVLVKAGILEGDDWKRVSPITIDCGGVDKKPRCEVFFD